MNSSRKNSTERFLQDLANLKAGVRGATTRINYKGAAELLHTYRNRFPPSFPHDSALARVQDEMDLALEGDALTAETTEKDRVQSSLAHCFNLSRELRKVWDEPDRYTRNRFIVELRHKYRAATLAEVVSETEFDRDMDYLAELGEFAKHCTNPACPHPYFIATKRSIKNCSPECSAAAQRRFKNEWWAEHGPGWRKRRRVKKTRKGGRK